MLPAAYFVAAGQIQPRAYSPRNRSFPAEFVEIMIQPACRTVRRGVGWRATCRTSAANVSTSWSAGARRIRRRRQGAVCPSPHLSRHPSRHHRGNPRHAEQKLHQAFRPAAQSTRSRQRAAHQRSRFLAAATAPDPAGVPDQPNPQPMGRDGIGGRAPHRRLETGRAAGHPSRDDAPDARHRGPDALQRQRSAAWRTRSPTRWR